jgi:hypothetical protein
VAVKKMEVRGYDLVLSTAFIVGPEKNTKTFLG